MVLLYEVALYLVLILGLPFFLFRRKYASTFSERMGHYRTASRGHDVWIHAVSVGETLAAKPVVDQILRLRPEITIVFTTTTATGQAQAAERFRAIGASDVEVAGNVKFDYVPDERPLDFDLLALAAGRPIIVLGSTMEGEDEALLPEVLPLGAFVVVAPRKPERFDVVASLASGLVRRSDLSAARYPLPADLLLLDTIGELARVYRHATVAFIGGSLVPTGGHNPIEPAAVGVPTCFGPHMTNFREIASVFVKNGAAAEVTSAREVAAFARRMIGDV